MICHLISRIMLSISSTPGASRAKIKALRVKDQNDVEIIFRCIVEKSESFVKVCKVFLLHWRFVLYENVFSGRNEELQSSLIICKTFILPRGFVIVSKSFILPWGFVIVKKLYLTLGFCHMRTNLPTFPPIPSCQTC